MCIVERMTRGHRLQRRKRRVFAHQRIELLVFQHLLDRAQTIRPLGMALRRLMVEAGGMAEEKGRHRYHLDPPRHLRKPHRRPPIVTPLGGGGLSGMKMSTCNGWLGSTRYFSKS